MLRGRALLSHAPLSVAPTRRLVLRPRERFTSHTLQLAQIIDVSIPAPIADPVLREPHRVVMSIEQLVDEVRQRCGGLGNWFRVPDFQVALSGRGVIVIRILSPPAAANPRRGGEVLGQ